MIQTTKLERKIIQNLKQKKFRDRESLFVVEGVKMVQEVLDSDYMVRALYTLEEGLFSGLKMTKLITEREMSEISHLTTPSPALALVEMRKTDLFQELNTIDKSQLYLGLDAIRDPGNFGTIIRIADWFGVKAIFATPDSVDLYNSKVIQASMGAIFRVPVFYVELTEIIDKLNIPVWGAALTGVSVYESPLSNNGIIIIGNEASGISEPVMKRIDQALLIPPYPHNAHSSESLNAAIATAIICSEFRRRLYI